MKNREIESLTKKFQKLFEEAKQKYKGKSPRLTFFVSYSQGYENIGIINEDTGEIQAKQKRLSSFKKFLNWLLGSKNTNLEIQFNKYVQKMESLQPFLEEGLKKQSQK